MELSTFKKFPKKASKHETATWNYFDSQGKIDAATLHQALANPEQVPELLQELEQNIYGYNRFY